MKENNGYSQFEKQKDYITVEFTTPFYKRLLFLFVNVFSYVFTGKIYL
jgi:hypothetical protein